MQIPTRSLNALVLVLLAAACGSASDPEGMPAANCFFRGLSGTVMGGSQICASRWPSSSAPRHQQRRWFSFRPPCRKARPPAISGGGQSATLATAAVVRENSGA